MSELDKEELRRLAEAATGGRWVTDGDSVNQHGSVVGHYIAHEKGGRIAEAFANCLVRTDAKCRTNAAFIAAANPAAILSLLDQNDGLLAQHGRDSNELRSLCQARDDARKERYQLRAENERLRKDADRLKWLCERVGVSHAYGDFMPWMPTGPSLLTDQEKLETEQSIDAAMAKEGNANG